MAKKIDRRDFLKTLGISTAAVTGVSISSCTNVKDVAEQADEKSYTDELPAGKMTYRVNPNTGDKVSILGYGCMRWPEKPDPADPSGEKTVLDQDQINHLVDVAMEHGVNYYDTSPVYCQGKSETVTGIALKRHPRDKFFIATKMSNVSLADPSFTPEQVFERSKQMFFDSLKNLQTDYIDYYLLHTIGGGGDDCFGVFDRRFMKSGVLDFLVEQKKLGKIRNLGFSFHGDVRIFDYCMQLHDEGKYHWDFVQIQMNYVDWQHAKENNPRNVNGEYLYGELEKRNIMSVIMEPLLGGRLSKLPNHVALNLKQRDPEATVASWAFRFAGSPDKVLCVLSGMTYMEHLLDNLRSFSPLRPLNDEEKAFLFKQAGIIAKFPIIQCNDCKYCMPCPYGIDIPAIFLHYNKCLNQDFIPESVQDPDYRKLRKIFLVGYDRSVPKLRQADHCIGCDQCSPHCPQQIRIPKTLHMISKFVEDLKQDKLGVEPEEA